MFSMLLPYMPRKLLIKRLSKNRGKKNQLHRALLQCCELLFHQKSGWISASGAHGRGRIEQMRCTTAQHPFPWVFQT